jgi:hypothetical protein
MLFYVDKANAALPVTGNPYLIVTAAIGELYMKLWDRVCRPCWENYAARWNADIVVLTGHIDDSEMALARSPAWQKLLILALGGALSAPVMARCRHPDFPQSAEHFRIRDRSGQDRCLHQWRAAVSGRKADLSRAAS